MHNLKIISINIEKNKHYDSVLNFIDKEVPDVVCMQEVPETFLSYLNERGFKTEFAPMFEEMLDSQKHKVRIAIASKLTFECKTQYYQGTKDSISLFDPSSEERNLSLVYLFANIATISGNYSIATTHAPDTVDGTEDAFQTKCMKKALSLLDNEEPHVICGDFNMPRGYNKLYEDFTQRYLDKIPPSYTSSLDRKIHRLGSKADLNRPIFDIYMVDYIFSQPPFIVSDVRLEFGVSDHAAVIANISISK